MIDISPVEMPREAKIKELSTHMYGLVGSITGDKLHRTYASRRADHDIDHNSLTEVQKLKVDYIKRNFTPEEAVACVLQYPPTVFVDVGEDKVKLSAIRPKKPITNTQPSPFDREIALRNTLVDQVVDDKATASTIEEYVKVCKKYLELPIITDDFPDHNQRRDWERGIHEVFNIMGREWNDAFSRFWDYSRYAKNKQTSPINYAEVILDMPNLKVPERLKVKFGDISSKMREGRERFLEGDMKGIDMIASQCSRVVNTFTEEQIKMDKLISEMFNSVVASITARYPITIPPDRSKPIELLPKEREVIEFIRQNADGIDLSYFILDNPPVVVASMPDGSARRIQTGPIKSTPPTEDENKMAKKYFALPPEVKKENGQNLEQTVSLMKNYLRMPKRKDDFPNHDERGLWQKGVNEILEIVDNGDHGRTGKDRWNWVFNRIWSSNKYRGTSRTYVITGLQTLMSVPLPEKIKKSLEGYLEKAKEGQTEIEEGQLDQGVELIAQQCIDAVALFSTG